MKLSWKITQVYIFIILLFVGHQILFLFLNCALYIGEERERERERERKREREPDQSGTGSDGNERVLHIPQIYKDGASAADGLE